MRKQFTTETLAHFNAACRSTDGIKTLGHIMDFAKEHDCVWVSLNTAWVENSENRRTISDFTNVKFISKPKISDENFIEQAKKKYGKRNIILTLHTFWGWEKIIII